ncbi:hypothetical protein BT63DRAFT_384905, partial [Microthyrium microscopicum]
MEDTTPLASLSLTHVSYDPTSLLSHLCAYLALVPQALIISYLTLLYATRELEILLMFAGQLACEAANFILKRYIREERPTRLRGRGYGMPSSHAQYVAYFGVYLALFLLIRHEPTVTPWSKVHRVGVAGLGLVGAGCVAVSRIYLGYHT